MQYNFAPFGIATSSLGSSNSMIRNTMFGSLNGQTLVVTGSGVLVNGRRLDQHTLPVAERIEIIALDKDGNKLGSFQREANVPITLEISTDGNIDRIETETGDITIKKAQNIEHVKTASGSIHVHMCKSIGHASTMSGNVSAQNCDHLGSASSMSGNVHVASAVRRGSNRDASPVRDRSPVPAKGKKKGSKPSKKHVY